ncbi:MAG: sigma-70 family RNA polymerase sigma factor [Planctomycetota bacterium]|nr:sigma-70 family RNA polymerase sigma factor [Planctomycetota bacterium]
MQDPADMADGIGAPADLSETGTVRFEEASARAERREARAALAGDRESVERLWQRHRRWVAAILLAYKPRWADLDDLLQDVAVSVVRKVHELRDPAAVRPWLRTVAINAAHAAGRTAKRRGRDERLEERDAPAEPGRPGGTPPDEGGRLLELAATLPEGYREPLLLKAVQGLSYREIGQILGLPETTIETRIARGRRRLRELATAHGIAPDA